MSAMTNPGPVDHVTLPIVLPSRAGRIESRRIVFRYDPDDRQWRSVGYDPARSCVSGGGARARTRLSRTRSR